MLKEIALIALDGSADRDSVLNHLLGSLEPAGLPFERVVVSRVIPSSNPAAVGSAAGYDLMVESWFAADRGAEELLPLVDRTLPELAGYADRQASHYLVCREVVLKEPLPSQVNIVSLLKRPEEKSFEEFSHYWRVEHGRIVRSVEEFWRHIRGYVQNHPLRETSHDFTGREIRGIDGITQLWFADDATAVTAFSEPGYLEIVRPDELALRSGSPRRILVETVREWKGA